MNALARFLHPTTLPQGIVIGSIVLALGAVFVAFIKKAPFYAFLFALALLLFLFLVTR